MLCKIFGKMDVVVQCKKKFKASIQIKIYLLCFVELKKQISFIFDRYYIILTIEMICFIIISKQQLHLLKSLYCGTDEKTWF